MNPRWRSPYPKARPRRSQSFKKAVIDIDTWGNPRGDSHSRVLLPAGSGFDGSFNLAPQYRAECGGGGRCSGGTGGTRVRVEE